MAKNRGHEHEVSLTFKYAYRPSSLRQQSNAMVSPQVSPRGSQINIAEMNPNPRPPVCSPSSLPLRHDAIFQSFPSPSPRGSPRRSSGAGKTSTRTPPLQNVQISSPMPSPNPSPHRTPQGSPLDNSWGSSVTASSVTNNGAPVGSYVRRSGASAPPLDGGGSLKLPDGQNSNEVGENLEQERDHNHPRKSHDIDLGKEADILGFSPHPPHGSPESSRSHQKKKSPTPQSGPSTENRTVTGVSSNHRPVIKQRRTSGFLQFMRSPLTFPVRGQSRKEFIYNCIPGMHRKASATLGSVPKVPSLNELPNNRISHNRSGYESTSSPKQSPSLKTPTPIDLSNVSPESDITHKKHYHNRSAWRHKKQKSHDNIPTTVETKKPLKQQELHYYDDDPTCCYVAGEAHRFRTPLESPRIPGTPPTPSAISPRTADAKDKHQLPSYFDLRRRETSDVSPNDLGFTLMPLSDPDLPNRTGGIQTHAQRLPHFVRVPVLSRAAPFATKDDYNSYTTEASPEPGSRRSSFPPGPGWSSDRSSASGTLDARRASFGYRDHMNFITKPEGYSSRTGSSMKQESNSGSGSSHESHRQRRDSQNTTSDASHRGSLGERRASKVIAALNDSRRSSAEQRLDDEVGTSVQSSASSPRMVHWRGAEVTEEEAKILDMLVGKHRLFSEILITPLEKNQGERHEGSSEPKDEPISVMRRPSWRRFASTIMASPLSGLSEETGSSGKTAKLDSGDVSNVPDVKELYAEALQETTGVQVGSMKKKLRDEDIITRARSLPPHVADRLTLNEFITAPPDIIQNTDESPIDALRKDVRSGRTTRTEYETEILSIAMLYGRVVQEATKAASEPSTPPPADINASASTLRPRSRAPSLTVPERPSVSFITNALDERSVSDGLISDVRRVSLNPTSKSRRASSTLAKLQKLVTGGGEKSKRGSISSPFSSPPEYVDHGNSRHQSLNVPSLISALTRESGKDGSLGSMDGRKS